MLKNKLIIGNRVFEGKKLDSGKCVLSNSLTGEELSIDTLTANVVNSEARPTRFCPKGTSGMLTADRKLLTVRPFVEMLISNMREHSYGEPVYYYHNEKLVGKFFLSSTTRRPKYIFELSCISGIGLLDNSKHYGGIYESVRLDDLVREIIGGVIEYRIDSAVAAIPMSGWLPIDSRRSNLHAALFAAGASVKRDPDGTIRISYLESTNKIEIGKDRVFEGGDVVHQSPATKVVVTEHAYIRSSLDESATLYTGVVVAADMVSPKGVSLRGHLLKFQEPMHDLSITSGTILESAVNYAVLGPASDCALTGLKYTHITSENTKGADASETAENTIPIEDCTLVNSANSESVAKRILSYYAASQAVSVDIEVENERPGLPAKFTDPFDDEVDGFIESMKMNFSGLLRATTHFADGFVPVAPGNTFAQFAALTGTGDYIVPSGVYLIRLAVISGGNGGRGGSSGEPSQVTSIQSGSIAKLCNEGICGTGGAGGTEGAPGRVFEIVLQVNPGDRFSYRCGDGGTGSEQAGVDGNAGSDTIFGAYSSADGIVYASGYKNVLNGAIYAYKGVKGVAGGRGAGAIDGDRTIHAGDKITVGGVEYIPGATGVDDFYDYGATTVTANGGFGGGPAAGSHGVAGKDGNHTGGAASGRWYCWPGTGGKGADAGIIPGEKTVFGAGGDGGHGGGGGGSHGYGRLGGNAANVKNYYIYAYPSEGGKGSRGGKGGPGGIIVYW